MNIANELRAIKATAVSIMKAAVIVVQHLGSWVLKKYPMDVFFAGFITFAVFFDPAILRAAWGLIVTIGCLALVISVLSGGWHLGPSVTPIVVRVILYAVFTGFVTGLRQSAINSVCSSPAFSKFSFCTSPTEVPANRVGVGLPAYKWQFQGSRQGWDAEGASSENLEASGWRITPGDGSTGISRQPLQIVAARYHTIQITLASSCPGPFVINFYHSPDREQAHSEQISFEPRSCPNCSSPQYQTYTMNVGHDPAWNAAGLITGLRLSLCYAVSLARSVGLLAPERLGQRASRRPGRWACPSRWLTSAPA